MKKTLQSLVLVTVLSLSNSYLKAQQDPYVTHYMFNRTMYNPAAVGAGGRFCLSAMSHYQYVGYEDRTPEFHPQEPTIPNGPKGTEVKSVGPKTQMFSLSAPINRGSDPDGNRINYGGLGIAFMNDKLGYELSTNIKLQACGRLPFADGGALAVGFEYDFLQKGLIGQQLKPLAPNDPRIPSNTIKQILPNYTAGVYYNNPLANSGGSLKDLWGGISVTNLKQQVYTLPSSSPYSTTVSHYYLMGGVTKEDFMGNPNMELLPSVLVRYNTVAQVELTGLVRYQKKLWGGLNYRTTADALSVMLGYQIDNAKSKLNGLRIGYSYDLTLSKIFKVSSGSHELQLNYCFDVVIPPKPIIKIINPRHLDRDINLD